MFSALVRSSILARRFLAVSSCFSVFMVFSSHLVWGGGQGEGFNLYVFLFFLFYLLFLICTPLIMLWICYVVIYLSSFYGC